MTQGLNEYLAQTLRAFRKQQGWSLDRAAKETGVSKAMLGQIERGESSPTVATLWKIAGGFGTSLSSFIEPPLPANDEPVVRSAEALRQQPAPDEMWVATVFPFDPHMGFEVFELTLHPGYVRQSEPHEPGVVEHLIVQQGKLEVLLQGQWQALNTGEAVRFAADQPHGYRNSGSEPAVFYDIIHYPGEGR